VQVTLGDPGQPERMLARVEIAAALPVGAPSCGRPAMRRAGVAGGGLGEAKYAGRETVPHLADTELRRGTRMTHHPKERPNSLSRRDFLLRSAGAAAAFYGAPGLLAACGNTTSVPEHRRGGAGPGGLPLARPDKRVTLPRWEDPIESGLKPETGGTFTVFNYPAYLYKKLLTEFGAKYGVEVQYTPFDNVNSGLQRLASGAVTPDVMEITPDTLDIGVAGKLIKPLNLDYIPNLQKNIWPQLVDPFYDGESRYTVPYTCYATGIAWRTDEIKQDIAGMNQPWDIFWESQAYKGKVALLSENRETIGMALLRKGITDINTEDPRS
jgi:spermidine/putrescine transport system substrate-binding protein